MGKIDDRLAELGYVLPEADVPPNKFVNIARTGNLLFTGVESLHTMLLIWLAGRASHVLWLCSWPHLNRGRWRANQGPTGSGIDCGRRLCGCASCGAQPPGHHQE